MNDVLVIIICFVNLFLWIFLFFYFKKKFSSQEILENIRQEIDKLLIEISRETDRDITLLDDRMNELKALLQEAEDRTSGLKTEMQKVPEVPKEPIHLTQRMSEQLQAVSYSQSNVASAYIENSRPAEQNVRLTKPRYQEEKEDQPVKELTLKDKVLDLWKLGFDSVTISEKLSVSLTEIQMIIDMFG